MLQKLLLFAFLLAWQQPAGPTLQETTTFIHEKVSGAKFSYVVTTWRGRPEEQSTEYSIYQLASFIDCQIYIATTGPKDSTGHVTNYREHSPIDAKTLNLREIEATKITLGDTQIPIVLLPNSHEPAAHAPYVMVGSDALAERVANAFRGMGRLCGAKEDPY